MSWLASNGTAANDAQITLELSRNSSKTLHVFNKSNQSG